MRQVLLTRQETGDEGTFGVLSVDGGGSKGGEHPFTCVTLELPWRGNKNGVSCIPPGTYSFRRVQSPKNGNVYEALPDSDAPGRANIQIHPANLAGDKAKGYKAQLLGCIALGASRTLFLGGTPPAGEKDQRGVSGSKTMVAAFEKEMAGEAFELTIVWAPGVAPSI